MNMFSGLFKVFQIDLKYSCLQKSVELESNLSTTEEVLHSQGVF